MDYTIHVSAHKAHRLKQDELYYIAQHFAAEFKRNGVQNMETDIDGVYVHDVRIGDDMITVELENSPEEIVDGAEIALVVMGIASIGEVE